MANKHVVFWSTAVIVFLVDRITKFLVEKNILVNESLDFPFFSLTHVYNTGTLFGLFKNASIFFILFAIIISVFLIIKYSSFEMKFMPVLGLILGGALGNLVDRFWYGAVLDFFDVHFWPVFNIADSAITVAIVLLLVIEYWPKRKI